MYVGKGVKLNTWLAYRIYIKNYNLQIQCFQYLFFFLPFLKYFLNSRFRALREGLSKETGFFRADLWKHNLKEYDNIVIFGVEQMVIYSAEVPNP